MKLFEKTKKRIDVIEALLTSLNGFNHAFSEAMDALNESEKPRQRRRALGDNPNGKIRHEIAPEAVEKSMAENDMINNMLYGLRRKS